MGAIFGSAHDWPGLSPGGSCRESPIETAVEKAAKAATDAIGVLDGVGAQQLAYNGLMRWAAKRVAELSR